MVKRNCAAVVAVLIAASGWPCQAQSASTEVRIVYESLRDAMYNDEPLERLESLYERSMHALREAGLPAGSRDLWRSRIEFVLARGYDAASDKPKARAHYELGLAHAEAALRRGASSEAWRLRSENLGRLCMVRGLGFLLANGRKAIAYAEKALELDPKNAAAQVIVAASKVYPPPLFGGNPEEGIRLLQQALAAGTAERDDLFNIYSGIGLAYAKLKSKKAAQQWLLKALALYPGNSFVLAEYSRACHLL